ncbi:MAG: RidA family protein [Candidatus Rokuibacteriota bacterium]
MKTIVNPPGLAKPSGFSHGIEARGRLLFLAGQTAQDQRGRIVAPGDLVAQFRQALVNVGTVLQARGGTLGDLVKVTFYVVDKDDYRAKVEPLGRVYREMLGGYYPATTLVEVKALWDDEALVEIDGIAVLEGEPPAAAAGGWPGVPTGELP